MTELQLARKYPKAFAALPILYQNDNCLFFWKRGNVLFAKPSPNQISILGTWVAYFKINYRSWVIRK